MSGELSAEPTTCPYCAADRTENAVRCACGYVFRGYEEEEARRDEARSSRDRWIGRITIAMIVGGIAGMILWFALARTIQWAALATSVLGVLGLTARNRGLLR